MLPIGSRPLRGVTWLALLAACARADAREGLSEPAFDTLAGGVVQVTNTGPTAWADTNGWKLVEERVIQPAEGSPGELSHVSGLAADAAGNVYVMQEQPVRISVFGPDGGYLRDIGREGDGPGEFRFGMLGIVGDTLFVQDPNNTRLTTFLTDGTFLASHHSQCCWFTSSLTVLTDGRALILGPPQGGDGRGAWYFTRMDGTVTDTLMMPAERPEEAADFWRVTRRSGQSVSMRTVSIPMRPGDQAEIRPDGQVIRGRTDSYRLVIGDTFEDSSRIILGTAPTLTVTDAQRDSAYRATLDAQRDDWRDAFAEIAKLGDIPGTWPTWTAMTVDRDNNTWVALPGDRGEYSRMQVFNPEGVLLGDVPAVGAGIFNGFWTRTHVYVGTEDDSGLPMIRVYRIVKSS
jgi:hypothetical protein